MLASFSLWKQEATEGEEEEVEANRVDWSTDGQGRDKRPRMSEEVTEVVGVDLVRQEDLLPHPKP